MPLTCTAGKITDAHEKANVKWEIPDFRNLTYRMHVDEYIESPHFYFFNARWCLRLFPFGDSQSCGWVALYLSVETDGNGRVQFPITFALTLKDFPKEIKCGKEARHTFEYADSSYGFTKIIRRNELAAYKSGGQSLIVCCNATANISFDAVCQTSGCNTSFFCHDYQDLFVSGKKSDVTIKVDDQVFKAHRWILETCSPVFDAMFKNDMSEKHDGIVKIDDCDPSVFKNFLQCIYTGKVEDLLPENIISLYVVADKYCVIRLKEKCADLMAEKISVDTACNILILAEKYKETQLQKSAEKFILQNIETIPKIKWSWLMSENSLLAAEILTKKVFAF